MQKLCPAVRLAIFTLESLANAAAVRRFVTDLAPDIALVGLSNPYRRSAGGAFGQVLHHLRRSGWRFMPYLFVNFLCVNLVSVLPRLNPLRVLPEKTKLRTICRQCCIKVVSVDDVNGEAVRDALRREAVDLIVSFHFDQIFDEPTLSLARLGGINVHPSLLPMHRGPVPTFYALLEDPPLFGVTIHRLAKKIDSGEILAQKKVDIPNNISVIGAAIALHEEGRRLLEEVLGDVPRLAEAVRPSGQTLPYCPFPSPALLRRAGEKGVALVNRHDMMSALRTAF